MTIAIDTRPATLVVLRNLVDEILLACSPEQFNEAINWGDLGCCWAGAGIDEDGTMQYLVEIDEASPDGCPALCAHVYAELERAGWTGVRIRTEW